VPALELFVPQGLDGLANNHQLTKLLNELKTQKGSNFTGLSALFDTFLAVFLPLFPREFPLSLGISV